MQDTAFKTLPLAVIARSLTNPRKTFDPVKLQGLAESIAASGVHQAILVRPLPQSRLQDTFSDRQPGDPLPEYELVAGERRWRASGMAGAQTIPAIVRDLSDEQVVEIQVIENLQRDDLSALEEAEGFQTLLVTANMGVDELSTRVGKSRTHVYTRLQLLNLSAAAKEAMAEGKLDPSRALLIARIPDDKLQAKALKALTETGFGDEPRLSYRAARQWIQDNVMLNLERAVFETTDATLLAAAGSCGDCPKRTGANPDLFGDVGNADMCTDPACYRAKESAHHDQVVTEAEKSGIQVISGEEAAKVMPASTYMVDHTNVEDYVQDPRTGAETPLHMLLEELLDKASIKAATRLVIDPRTHKPVKVVTDELVGQLTEKLDKLTAKSKTVSKAERASARDRVKESEDRQKHALAAKYETAWRGRVLAQLKPQLLGGAVQAFEPTVLRVLLAYLCTSEASDTVAAALGLADNHPALDSDEAMEAHIGTIADLELGTLICVVLASVQAEHVERWHNGAQVIVPAPALLSLADSAGVNTAAIQAEVQDEMREELGLPTQKPAQKPARGKKAKLSAAEAQAGMAKALASKEAAEQQQASGEHPMPSDKDPWPFPNTSSKAAKEPAALVQE